MTKVLYRLGWLVGLVLLQALVLNHVHIAGYATPFVYIYFLLKMPSDTTRVELMLWAFGLGLAVDVFSDTPGMNAAAAVLMAFCRDRLLNLYLQRETVESIVPGTHSMGLAPFLRYMGTCVLVHHAALLALEYLSLAHVASLVLHVVSSAVLTSICIMGLESLNHKPS